MLKFCFCLFSPNMSKNSCSYWAENFFYNVKKLSFSYWYNLFIAVRKTQILLNGSYLPLTLPMKKYRQATMQK